MADRVDVLGCQIDRVTLAESVERCARAIDSRTPLRQVSINAAKLVSLRRDPRLRSFVASCGLVNADGQSIVWASRLFGHPLPERVAGIDLMLALLDRAAACGYRVFILGARAAVLEAAIGRLADRWPELKLAGFRDGYFTDGELRSILQQINASRADVLFIAVSSPRKEYLVDQWGPELDVPYVMGVGGAIDVLAGVTSRAPHWLQRAGLEWLYRLTQEPIRLGYRYITTNATFVAIVTREWATRKFRQKRPAVAVHERTGSVVSEDTK